MIAERNTDISVTSTGDVTQTTLWTEPADVLQPASKLEPVEQLDAVLFSPRKSHGVHYTPPQLASFVARRALAQVSTERCTVLDPACGDGELLMAVALEAKRLGRPALHLVGVDRDGEAVRVAQKRLKDAPAASVLIRVGDFLAPRTDADDESRLFDLVISNPPYVRTQVLGAKRAQELGRQFDLAGRVDLYHAFVAAITADLAPGGVLGLLCSNRFLTTKGGCSLRALLLRSYEVAEVWDLGDTKLFEAAVLPAIVIARRAIAPSAPAGSFVRVYQDHGTSGQPAHSDSLFDALAGATEGSVQVGGRGFTIDRGQLQESDAKRAWTLTSATGMRWTTVVREHSVGRLADLGPIRVGIKTTADSVFIRPSWDELPEELRPEEALLHPLLTHRVAGRWRAAENAQGARWVLYTHETQNGRRRAIDLSSFPLARAYLEQHRARLEGRKYVLKAGRAWYEIWVPQQPDAWAGPKLVWPDISDRPKFFLDRSGAIVNGDCYWLSCGERSDDETALAMAVANSTFALQHYDACCGNRLYAGRRRFITQYLEDLPIPGASSAALSDIRGMVDQLRRDGGAEGADVRSALESELDATIFELFGLQKKRAR